MACCSLTLEGPHWVSPTVGNPNDSSLVSSIFIQGLSICVKDLWDAKESKKWDCTRNTQEDILLNQIYLQNKRTSVKNEMFL